MGSGQFDSVAECAEFADHFLSAPQLGHLGDLWASFLVANSEMQDLPDQATKFVGNYPNRVLVSQARYIAAIEIDDLETAKYVSQLLLGINDQLEQSISVVEKGTSPTELKAYKRGVGYVIYEVFDKILQPVYLRHPSLKPPGLD